MVFGPGDRRGRFDWIIEPMRAGAATIAALRAWLDWCTTYIAAEDAGRALALAAVHPDAQGEVFHVGLEPVSRRVWIERFAALTGWRGAVEARDAGPIAQAVEGLDLGVHLRLDCAHIWRVIGFAPQEELSEALRRLVG